MPGTWIRSEIVARVACGFAVLTGNGWIKVALPISHDQLRYVCYPPSSPAIFFFFFFLLCCLVQFLLLSHHISFDDCPQVLGW